MEEEEIKSELDEAIEELKQIVSELYTINGFPEFMEFKTSQELVYELQESIDTTIQIMNKTLFKMGFQNTMIDGTMCWVLFINE